MKLWAALFGLAGVGAAALSPPSPEPHVLLLSGDTDGYLSPCGCTKPMSGGILRRATAVKTLAAEGRTTILENGGLIGGRGRQDVLKAETLAQALRSMGVTAVHVGEAEAALGQGMVMALGNLMEGRLMSGSLRPSETNRLARTLAHGPFLIGAASADPDAVARPLLERPMPMDESIRHLLDEARDAELVPILMLRGNLAQARAAALRWPDLRLIQYRSGGSPPAEPERVGRTLLVTPGERGIHVLRLLYHSDRFEGYLPVRLGPEHRDDPDAQRLYSMYQHRVRDEKLLEQLPRNATAAFAGSKTCGSCHVDAKKVWSETTHAGALATLERDGHDRDPDCVGCHVVALDSTQGFRSRGETPDLADVGCESCHGPGLAHAMDPTNIRTMRDATRSCVSCHTPTTSPGFDFPSFWQRIQH
jgi:hypothetical protein